MGGVDAGTIYSAVRIKLNELNADLSMVRTYFDQLGVEIKQKGDAAGKGFLGGLSGSLATMRDVMMGPVAIFKEVSNVITKISNKVNAMEGAWATQAEASALLANTLKTTGAEAWTTKEHLEELAGAIQATTKYGDQTVESMQSVLLGFRNIQGENFDHATNAVLDMATVMKMDLTAAAQAVGKALDNPALGLDSLSKQGFKFTDAEKAMMKSMQDAGDIAGAQAMIFKELDKTFGGAAKAAGELDISIKDRLNNAIGDLNEQIGRSISRGLTPFRKLWLDIATSIGAAAKAQNDFRDALDRSQKGTGETKDRISDLEIELKSYQKLAESYDPSTDMSLWEGGNNPYEKVIAAIKQQIVQLKALQSAQESAQRYLDEKAEQEAERAAAELKRKEIIAAVDKELAKLEITYKKAMGEADAALKAGSITSREYKEKELEALNDLAEGIGAVKEKYTEELGVMPETTKKQDEIIKKSKELAFELNAETVAIEENENAWKERRDTAAAQVKSYDDVEHAIAEALAGYSDEIDALNEAAKTGKSRIVSDYLNAMKMVDAYEAQGHSVDDLREKLREYYALLLDGENEEEDSLTRRESAWREYSASIESIINGIAEAIGAMYESELEALEEQYEYKKELIENDGKTKKQALQDELAAAIEAGDEETIAEAQKNLDLYNLDEEYQKQKAELQYKSDLAEWTANGLRLAQDTAVAIMKAWADGGLAMEILATAAGVTQTAAWIAAKPSAPSFGTGGLMTSTGSTAGRLVELGDNHGGDIFFGTGALGQPLMEGFMDEIADRVVARQGPLQVTVPLSIDGKAVAQATARRFNSGEVPLKR